MRFMAVGDMQPAVPSGGGRQTWLKVMRNWHVHAARRRNASCAAPRNSCGVKGADRTHCPHRLCLLGPLNSCLGCPSPPLAPYHPSPSGQRIPYCIEQRCDIHYELTRTVHEASFEGEPGGLLPALPPTSACSASDSPVGARCVPGYAKTHRNFVYLIAEFNKLQKLRHHPAGHTTQAATCSSCCPPCRPIWPW